MPSGRRLGSSCGLAAAAVVVVVPLAGCTTTQEQARRVQLNSARLRAAQLRTRVAAGNPAVPAVVEAVLRAHDRAAFVVTVDNRGSRPVTDLPISIGYLRRGGRSVYLNGRAGAGYFDSHLPAIRAGASITWVYRTTSPVPAAARWFARVGARQSVPARVTVASLSLGVRVEHSARQLLTVRLWNHTSVPQYQLQVYADARRGARYVAAGSATVADLGAGSAETLRLHLVGSDRGADVQVAAIPTILE